MNPATAALLKQMEEDIRKKMPSSQLRSVVEIANGALLLGLVVLDNAAFYATISPGKETLIIPVSDSFEAPFFFMRFENLPGAKHFSF